MKTVDDILSAYFNTEYPNGIEDVKADLCKLLCDEISKKEIGRTYEDYEIGHHKALQLAQKIIKEVLK